MEYVKFGNTGMNVSRLCLGAMEFYSEMEEDVAQGIIDKAIGNGINFIDTADAYGRGGSEEFLGRALKGGKRDRMVIATKFWVRMYKEPTGGGCSRYHVIRAVEDSLRRLQTDHIDLIQLHHPDPNTPVEELLSTLDTLVQQGKIRYIGVCNHFAWQMAHMLGVSALHNWEPICSIQCRYSIIDRPVEVETVPFCERFNIAMIPYGPLAGGILTGKYRRGEPLPEGSRVARIKRMQADLTDEVFDILDELQAMAEKYEIGMNQLAVAWLLSKPVVTSPILGGKRPEHFDPMYEVLDIEIEGEDLQHIDEISAAHVYQPFANQSISQGSELALNRW
jgi:aryl-alcohol dehydrogenase-like predicted oxidoreductase